MKIDVLMLSGDFKNEKKRQFADFDRPIQPHILLAQILAKNYFRFEIYPKSQQSVCGVLVSPANPRYY